MRHAANTALFDHWVAIRRERRTPDRRDIDPAAIRHVLAYTFMLEVDGVRPTARAYPVRVSGTRLDALFGRGVKDEAFPSLWGSDHGEELRTVIESVLDKGAPAVIGGIAAPRGKSPVAIEMLMLPLRCQGRTHARLLCSLTPVTTPTWLGLSSVEPLGLTSWRMIYDVDASPERRAGSAMLSPDAAAPQRQRFAVIVGGRSGDGPAFRPPAQHRVKAVMQRSGTMPLSTRNP